MGFYDFLERPIFNPRFKYPLHIAQVAGAILAFALTVPRLFATDIPRTRAGTYALGMSAKSLVLLAYILLSERHAKFKRFHSYKAHLIISIIEVIFWSVVFGLMFSTNVAFCSGYTCGLGWAVVLIAVFVVATNIIATGICFKELRAWKRAGRPKDHFTYATKTNTTSAWDEEYAGMQQPYPTTAPPGTQYKQPAMRAAEKAYTGSGSRRHSHRGQRPSQPEWDDADPYAPRSPRSPRSPREHRPRRSRERRRSHGQVERRMSAGYGREERYMPRDQRGMGEVPPYPGHSGQAAYPGYPGYYPTGDERY